MSNHPSLANNIFLELKIFNIGQQVRDAAKKAN